MLSYITLGANDMQAANRFYSALLQPLGYEKLEAPEGLAFTLAGAVTVYVKPPFDGKPATLGNGSMAAFRVRSHDLVRQLHAAGIAAGGTDEGAPGFRAEYSKDFFVAYLRDPVGNKIALFCKEPA
jgi:catechol 2,3-dioxygenase-like lactoylglutathione lyase family enzyme